MEYDHIMIDLETLAARPNAAIVSIGAARFNFTDGIRDTFTVNINAATCKAVGLHIDPTTIDWWMTQPKEVRRSWMTLPKPLSEALTMFKEWYGNDKHPIWAHGVSFDIPILEEAYIRCGIEKPWKYWNINDYRTILNLVGLNNRELRKGDEGHHTALDDAVAQAKTLIEILKDFKS